MRGGVWALGRFYVSTLKNIECRMDQLPEPDEADSCLASGTSWYGSLKTMLFHKRKLQQRGRIGKEKLLLTK